MTTTALGFFDASNPTGSKLLTTVVYFSHFLILLYFCRVKHTEEPLSMGELRKELAELEKRIETRMEEKMAGMLAELEKRIETRLEEKMMGMLAELEKRIETRMEEKMVGMLAELEKRIETRLEEKMAEMLDKMQEEFLNQLGELRKETVEMARNISDLNKRLGRWHFI